jgi:ATP-dependent Clp protease ATP-binding subunit ClpA
MIRLDMSEFMEASSVSKLIGAPPGFVGYNEKGFLTEKVKNNPYSLILIDEVEKASSTVINVFLQMFDEGKLTDNTGVEVNFKNCIIIMTSNIGTNSLMNNSFSGFISTTNKEVDVEEKVMKELKAFFRPELINRIDERIIFNSLTKDDVGKIVYLELSKLVNRLSEKGISIEFSSKVIDFIADNGYSDDFGARPIKRLIASEIETPVADVILSNKLSSNSIVKVYYRRKKVIVDGHQK